MKTMKIILASLMMLVSLCSSAQGIKVYLKDGTLLDYEITDISQVDIITLADGTKGFAVYDENGNKVTYPLTMLSGMRCQDETAFYHGHKAIDLGLPSGTLWAEYNIGATKPEEFGNYYRWGNADDWTRSTRYSPYMTSSGLLTKYCTNASLGYLGYLDNLTELLPEDDAAHVHWGDKWRTPTAVQKREMLQYTTHEWTERNGVIGWLFKSKLNDNSIFFPATGIVIGGRLERVGEQTNFWTSTLCPSDNHYAYFGCDRINGSITDGGGFDLDWQSDAFNLSQYRTFGVPVRPVYTNNAWAQKKYDVKLSCSATAATSADLSINIDTHGNTLPEYQWGICFDTYDNSPTVQNSKTAAVSATATTASNTFNDFKPNTKYYVRAYIIADGLYYYSNVIEVQTAEAKNVFSNFKIISMTDEEVVFGVDIDIDEYPGWTPTVYLSHSNYKPSKMYDPGYSSSVYKVTPDKSGYLEFHVNTLNPGWIYYAWPSVAFKNNATDSYQFSSGEVIEFEAPLPFSYEQEVDLGLSVNWAGFNVGTDKPYRYGSYFMWADPEPKADTHKYEKDHQYFGLWQEHYTTASFTLAPEDEMAGKNWGENWRVPTPAEWDELVNNCTWEFYTYSKFRTNTDGIILTPAKINGYIITGPNGNKIFLPLTNDKVSYWSEDTDWSYGHYWTNEGYIIYTDAEFREAYYRSFTQYPNDTQGKQYSTSVFTPKTVRAVCDK